MPRTVVFTRLVYSDTNKSPSPDFSFEEGTAFEVASQRRACLDYQQTEVKG
jgi:hypothetical protein